MDAQRRAEITGWDAREFSGGFSGLRRLVDRGFSGAVTDGTGWLFVFEGRVVGTVDGDLDAFADASGTVYEAPHKSLPILFAMQEQGGEPRAQYYTNDTPLSEADRKLSQGGFTGYVELSENVLSGDYYVTYTAGESMAAAYVGNSRRLETGDDAFSLADDEVGIYTVYEVDLNVREIPGEEAGGSGTTTETDGSASTVGSEGSSVTDEANRTEATNEANRTETATTVDSQPDDDAVKPAAEAGSESAGDETPEAADSTRHSGRDGDDGPRDAESRDDGPRDDESRDDGAAATDSTVRSGERNGARSTAESAERRSEGDTEAAQDSRSKPARDEATDDEERSGDDVFSEEEQWREQKSIPALDPSEASGPSQRRTESTGGRGSESPSGGSRVRSGRPDGPGAEARSAGASGTGRSPEPRSTESDAESRSVVSQRSTGQQHGNRTKRLQQLEGALEAAESERESLATERDDLEAERDDLAAERDELAGDVDRLERELASVREERDRLREELSTVHDRLPDTERTLSPAEARSGTNLFVRYDSKGGATLEDAHDGGVDRDALRENLRIEHHTSFETDGLAVDGRPYEEFLTETIEYGFTRWLVEDLPFEVSGTGNQSVLRDLYDALPEIDRAEIGGSVSVVIRESGEETREQRVFDLVLRDRMGNPLFVADLNDSRDPTAEGTLESLVENGRDIAESNDSFAAAFAVTESFFEPGALETASDAVGGGLFSRSKRASFVKLSRKRGYHLCLVEARDGGFHMTVPDL